MNVTELARKLRVTPNQLREMLPQMGFHIGVRAIKIDPRTAKRILKDWPVLFKRLKRQQEDELSKKGKNEAVVEEAKKVISIPSLITVRDFSEMSDVPVNKILAELMKNGVFASINEKIDFDTAMIIGENLNLEVNLDEKDGKEEIPEDNKIDEILEKEKKENLTDRPPVIVVMGHVDHGKTKLLDTIRTTDVVAGEHGGITQHIGAYQVTKNDRKITFIDTPGHEAFTAMRSRGAKIADVAILIVAADDGVKPQTVEAFNIIKASGIPFIVAINKVDKADADVNKTKQELSSKLGITPEDWGGKTICAEISALKGKGIDDLLEMILLTTDTEAKNMQANNNANAVGTVIESRVDKNTGPVATILVQNGTLRIGDQFCIQGKECGKARALKDYNGEDLKEAQASTPVKIIGLKIAPTVGDIVEVGKGEKMKGKFDTLVKKQSNIQNNSEESDDDDVQKLNLIIKSDVLGSVEAVEESLMKINTEEIKVKIVSKGLGNITPGDIDKAEATDAQIVGFNVKTTKQSETVAREKKVEVKNFHIIYDLIEYVREEMQKLLSAKVERINLGRLKVLAIFRTENKSQIIGGKVLDNTIKNNVFVEVFRNKEFITSGKIIQLQTGKQDVKEVEKDNECGITYQGKALIEEGDVLQFYEEKETISKL